MGTTIYLLQKKKIMRDLSMNELPLFSIAIPTYNRLHLLKKAVASAINQTYQNTEIVILNNASTDGTKEWIEQLTTTNNSKIKIINHSENLGTIGNVKSIPRYINGKYLVILSDDDLLETQFAEEAAKDLEESNDTTLWYCRTKYISEKGLHYNFISGVYPRTETGKTYIKYMLEGKRKAGLCSIVYRVQTLRDIGGFVGNTYSLDSSACCLCAARGMVMYNSKVLAQYFYHFGSTTCTLSISDAINSGKEVYELIVNNIDYSFKWAAIRLPYMEYEKRFKQLNNSEKIYFGKILHKEFGSVFWAIFLKRFPFLILKTILTSETYRRLKYILGKN